MGESSTEGSFDSLVGNLKQVENDQMAPRLISESEPPRLAVGERHIQTIIILITLSFLISFAFVLAAFAPPVLSTLAPRLLLLSSQ